jgi:hypothetical protein
MTQEWFNWQNKTLIQDQVYVLHDFLDAEIYDKCKNEIRTHAHQWHNEYANRIVADNVRSPVILELAARLLPYLNKEFNNEFCVTTAKIYTDLSGSQMFPHFDARDFHISMQLYMPDIGRDKLGTQFCFNQHYNSQVEDQPDILMRTKGQFVPDDQYVSPVPFRRGFGYINYNNKLIRTLHKTEPVPLGYVRESVHFNFNIKRGDQLGLENIHYHRLQGIELG